MEEVLNLDSPRDQICKIEVSWTTDQDGSINYFLINFNAELKRLIRTAALFLKDKKRIQRVSIWWDFEVMSEYSDSPRCDCMQILVYKTRDL